MPKLYHEEDEDNGQKDKEEDLDISMTSTRWYTSHVSSFHLRGMLGLFGVFDVFRVFGGMGGKEEQSLKMLPNMSQLCIYLSLEDFACVSPTYWDVHFIFGQKYLCRLVYPIRSLI